MPGRTRPSFGSGSRPGEHSARHTPGNKPISVDIEFQFDFGSPDGFLCHKLIPAIEERSGQRFRHLPVLLGGRFKLANNRSPAEASATIPNMRADEGLKMESFVRKRRLDACRFNPHVPVNRLKIMRGAVAAQRLRRFEPEVKATLLAHTESAHARGEFGSPTFFVAGEIQFDKSRLRAVEEAIVAAAAATKARMPQTPR